MILLSLQIVMDFAIVEIFGAGKNNTFKALHLLGWNDRHQNWGDEVHSVHPRE